MIKNILFGVLSALLVGIIGASIYLYIQLNQSKETIRTLEKTNTKEMDKLNSTLTQTQNENNSLEIELAAVKQEVKEKEEKIIGLENTNKELETSKAQINAEKNQIQANYSRLICDRQFDGMDYSSVLNATNRLLYYVSTLSGVKQVSLSARNTLWNNADTKVHVIRYVDSSDGEVYSKQFIVYMREFGWNTSTFYIDGQCWIDAP